MRAETVNRRRFTDAQRRVATRLAIVFTVATTVRYALPSGWLSDLTGKLALQPTNTFGTPIILLGSLMIAFVLLARDKLQESDLSWPSLSQLGITTALFLATIWIIFTYTHPGNAVLRDILTMAAISPGFYAPLLSSVLYTAILAPLVPAFGFVFSWRFLRRFWIPLVGMYFVVVLLLFSAVATARIYAHTVAFVLGLTSGLLRLVSPDVQVNVAKATLTFKSFTAGIGPQCVGMRLTGVFTVLFAAVWIQLAREHNCHHSRAIIAYLAALVLMFALNIIRIAAIMVVGSVWPGVGVMLFHGSIGFVLFLAVFALYLRLVVPWLRREAVTAPSS
jgi:exosortase/archaeosortase family protein